jgi:predicted dehydrogenase
MAEQKIRVGIIGCGNIAEPYSRDLVLYPEIELVGAADLDPARAQALADKFDCRPYPAVEDLLADPGIDLVVNLTVHHAHYAVTRQCLQAGKHVHSEKPLAMSLAEAESLVELARAKNLRLGCAPFTYMGEAQQTAWKWIRDGRLGTVRVAYAEVNWGRIERWHPAPAPFYEVGALFDVGVYPLTLLTAIFGPARCVWAWSKVLKADRLTKQGVPFHIETPDFVVATIELANGLTVRLTTDFYVSPKGKQTGIEFHGDEGSVHLACWQRFDAAVEFAEFDKPYAPVPLVQEPPEGTRWGRSVADMAQAIIVDKPHRATGEHAAHIVEILCAAVESARSGAPVKVRSTFSPPAPMEWAL